MTIINNINNKNIQDKQDQEPEKDLHLHGIVLPLPHTIRNISTKMTLSNSFMISNNFKYAVAGVRYDFFRILSSAQRVVEPKKIDNVYTKEGPLRRT